MDIKKKEFLNRRSFLALGSSTLVSAGLALNLNWLSIPALAASYPNAFQDLDGEFADKLLRKVTSHGGDFADLFFEEKTERSFQMVDDKLQPPFEKFSSGAGFRVISGSSQIFDFNEGLSGKDLKDTASRLQKKIKGNNRKNSTAQLPKRPKRVRGIIYSRQDLNSISKNLFDQILQIATTAAKQTSNLITQSHVTFRTITRSILVANSEGLLLWDVQPYIQLQISVTAKSGSAKSSGYREFAQKAGVELLNKAVIESLAAEAAEESVHNLSCEAVKSGTYPLILANGTGAALIHSLLNPAIVVNYPSQATFLKNAVGHQIASNLVTYEDNSSVILGTGSYHIDDEGSSARANRVIEKGIFKKYLTNKMSSLQYNLELTGNAHRKSYDDLPVSQTSNSILENGSDSADDILRDTPEGFYCNTFESCHVDIPSGNFKAITRQAFRIHDGEIRRPVQKLEISGNTIDLLQKIDRVADNLLISAFPQKQPDACPQSCGQPTIRIRAGAIKPV